jgi:3-oxoacyl-[acyl-carrier protein] reductase
MDDITNKVALVTGASRGIGQAVAVALAEAGVDVAVHYHTKQAEAEQVADEVRRLGHRAVVVQADVSVPQQVQSLAERVERELGPVEILVNNAAIGQPMPLDQIGLDLWNTTLATNLTSAFVLTQAVVPGMRQRRWGRIINLSSVAAQVGGVIGPHYAASKAGMLGLTHSYSKLLAKEGITANAIAPALVETDMVRNNPNARPDIIPVGRFGLVDEVSSVVVMLARNGYITGQTINVNGGWYMS